MLTRERARDLAAAVATDRSDTDLLWAVLPTLQECLETDERGHTWLETSRDLALRSGRIGPRLMSAGGVVAFVNTVNQGRALEPVVCELARRQGVAPKQLRASALRPGHVRRAWRQCDRLERDLMSAARGVGLRLDPARLRRRLLKAVRAAQLGDRLLGAGDHDTLLVSNQHLADHRSVLRVASAAGMTTLYVPHAPVADNDLYRDLPVAAAALRGPREVAFYERLGASSHRLYAAGNPAFPEVDPPSRLDGPVVLALSPWPRARLVDVVQLVEQGLGMSAPVVVAPHPRNRLREVRRVVPTGWSVHAGRTLDLLLQGPRLVLQHSSGIAWEALFLGIPTVEIAPNGGAPNYPLIVPPYVPAATSPEELGRLAVCRDHPVDRTALRDWASEWCNATGRRAAERVVDALENLPRPDELALDAWTMP